MFLMWLIILIRFIRVGWMGGVFGVVSFFCNFVECDVLIRQRFRRFLMQLTLWRL